MTALRAGETFEVTVDVTNTGTRDADDVLHLFVRMPVASQLHPLQRLAGFRRVSIPAGTTRAVTIAADPRALFRFDDDEQPVCEAGTLDLVVSAGTTSLTGSVTIATD
ncbi:fibronectin type III-like domain-contianing protein [Streptomyces sp. ME03-5709C]|nr:fibronectin type III-like domain-contianing protein [Streptomyces sp. ME03-5709C]